MPTFILVLVALSMPTVSWGQSAAEQAATDAQLAHGKYCAQVAGAAANADAAAAIVEVGAVWAQVSRVYEGTGATWLLYWSGLLAQCISQDDRAAEALVAFIESDAGSVGMRAMVRDAENRLKRLRPRYVRSKTAASKDPRAGSLGAGIALAVGAAAAGVGSGVGFGQFSGTRTGVATSLLSTAEVDQLIVQGGGQIALGVGFAAGAGVAAAASIAAFVGARGSRPGEAVAMPVPLRGGVGLVVGGRW